MLEKPDIMSESGESSRDFEMVVETMGSNSFTNEQPSVAEVSKAGKEKKPSMKTKQELLEDIILKHAMPPSVSADATYEQKQEDRRRRLNARTTRWRTIFSHWPRDPKGKYIIPENGHLGKMAPNGAQLWGATLFDFYSVRRIPDLMNLVTLSSGSKLAAWMKANGEDYAKSALEFAENEADPHLIFPYEITGLIQNGDVLMGKKSWVRSDQDEDNTGDGKGEGKEKEREDWQVPQPWPPASPFDAIAYPEPWPIEPFTKDYPKLQKCIIHSHLPTILQVHDPWNLLRAARISDREEWEEEKKKRWSDKTDVVHTYRLETSTKHTARRTEDDEVLKTDEIRRKSVYDKFVADPHSRNEPPSGIIHSEDPSANNRPGPVKPPIFIVFPFQPPIPPAREAHLYLSPNQCIGEGNHSFVYNAEFELPRSTIMEDEICHRCIMEDMYRTLKEQDGPNGERRDPKWDEEIGCNIAKTAGKPPMMVSLGDEDGSGEEEYLLEDSTVHIRLEYIGPYRLIHSKIGYQCLERGPYCEHIAKSQKGIHPLTAKVEVAAKLSVKDDHHLGREAEAYQAFPRHFFEHWSGFNLIKPLKEPTPVGPLVPQFYGYYIPDRDPAEQSDPDESGSGSPEIHQYLSPILLLENCGTELKPESLTLDDQSEAAALVFRFHDAGWLHGSVAKRNILIQPGPLSDSPLSRTFNTRARGGYGVDWSFRLIDFGRSSDIGERPEYEQRNRIIAEELTIQKWIFLEEDLD